MVFKVSCMLCSVCCSCSRVRKWELCLDHSEKKMEQLIKFRFSLSSSWLSPTKTHLALTLLIHLDFLCRQNKASYLLHSLKLSWNKSIGVIFLPPGPMLPIPMPLFKWFASIGWPPGPNPMPIPPRPSEGNIQISKKPSFHSLTKQQVLFLSNWLPFSKKLAVFPLWGMYLKHESVE